MGGAGDLDEAGARDAVGHPARGLGRHDRIVGSMEDQGRNADRRKDIANVDLTIHPRKRLERARARRPAEVIDDRARVLLLPPGQRPNLCRCLFAPTVETQVSLEVGAVLLLAPAPRVVRRPHHARKPAAEDERSRALWIRRGEQQAHRRAFGDTEDCRPGGADIVHHSPQVVHARLECRSSRDAVRHARSALVEQEQPREGRQLLEPAREQGHTPSQLDVRHESRHVDEVEGPVADHLIGDRDVAAPGVPGLGLHDG